MLIRYTGSSARSSNRTKNSDIHATTMALPAGETKQMIANNIVQIHQKERLHQENEKRGCLK
jgi:hypothetical protein